MGTISSKSLRRLAIFASVVDQGSFAGAARQLGTNRSGVSEQVALLESELGFRLLQRTTRQISLTSEGAEVYAQARELNRIAARVSSLSEPETASGRVRITCTADFAESWLVHRLACFRKHYPHIYYDLIVSDSHLDLVAESIDIAIRIGRPRDANFVARPIRVEAPRVVASRSYLEEFGSPERAADLANHIWILLAQINPGNRVTLSNDKEEVEFTPERYHIADSPLVARTMIEAGLGIGFHLPWFIQRQLESRQLSILVREWHEQQLSYSVVYPSRHNVPLRTRKLIEFLLQYRETEPGT